MINTCGIEKVEVYFFSDATFQFHIGRKQSLADFTLTSLLTSRGTENSDIKETLCDILMIASLMHSKEPRRATFIVLIL